MNNKTLHVCLLTSGRIFETSIGGEEKYTLSLARWLLEHNIQVTIMGSTFTGVKAKKLLSLEDFKNLENSPYELSNLKVKVLYPPYIFYLMSRMLLSLLWIIKITSTNRKSKIDIIHAQDTGFSGIAAIFSGRLLGIPTIITSHGIRHLTIEPMINGKLKRILFKIEFMVDKFTVKHSKKILAVNNHIIKYYNDLTSRQIELIPIPIKVHKFAFSAANRERIRKEFEIDESAIVLCYIGRLSPEKNIITLIDSFSSSLAVNPSLCLLLVGTGIMDVKLRTHVREKKLENKVVFAGVRKDIDKLISCADIFVLPSFTEGMSTALLEAMANGRAIICSNIPGNRHLISEEEGILFDPDRKEDLDSAISMLSNNILLRNKLGENAKRKVIEFDEYLVFDKILRFYNCTINKKIQ